MSRVEFNISLILSLADVIVLEGAFGRKNTVEIINSIDTWCFLGDDKKADIGVTRFSKALSIRQIMMAGCLHSSQKKARHLTSYLRYLHGKGLF